MLRVGKFQKAKELNAIKWVNAFYIRKPNKIHHNKWTCDGINFKSEEKGCLSGMMNDKKKYKYEPWGCDNCNFKLCISCVIYWKCSPEDVN